MAARFHDFTVEEAIELGRKHVAELPENVPSTTRTLLAYIEVLEAKVRELTQGEPES